MNARNRDDTRFLAIEKPMISFKGAQFPNDIILYAVFFGLVQIRVTVFASILVSI